MQEAQFWLIVIPVIATAVVSIINAVKAKQNGEEIKLNTQITRVAADAASDAREQVNGRMDQLLKDRAAVAYGAGWEAAMKSRITGCPLVDCPNLKERKP